MFGKLLTNQKIAHKIVKPYVYKALREGLKTHDNGKIQNLRGFDSLSLRVSYMDNSGSLDSIILYVEKVQGSTLGLTYPYVSQGGEYKS